VAIATHCNFRPNVSPVVLGYNNLILPLDSVSNFFSGTDISAINWHLATFLATCSLRMHRNCYFRVSGKMLTRPFYSVIPIFMERIFWRLLAAIFEVPAKILTSPLDTATRIEKPETEQ